MLVTRKLGLSQLSGTALLNGPHQEGRARSNKKSVQIVISLLRFRGASDKLIL